MNVLYTTHASPSLSEGCARQLLDEEASESGIVSGIHTYPYAQGVVDCSFMNFVLHNYFSTFSEHDRVSEESSVMLLGSAVSKYISLAWL